MSMYKNKKIVAIIPARKGSKGIKNKNVLKLTGIPLINFSIDYAKRSKLIDRVFVSTDGNKISKVSENYGAEIIKRPKKFSSDTASSESAIIHSINYIEKVLKYKFDIVVFLQPTTVLRKLGELDQAIKMFIEKKSDTLFASVKLQPFLWEKNKKKLRPVNFNSKKKRIRTQNNHTLTETGSYYIVKKEVFLKYNSRFGKNVINFDSDYYSLLEIDSISDFKYILELLKTNIPKKRKLCIPNKN